jgi:hypothetical protein
VIAILLTALLALLTLFQTALILGAPLGHFAWGGRHRVLPPGLRIGSAVGIAIYAFTALIALDRAGQADVFPGSFSVAAMWVVFAYFVLATGLNAISRSKHERLLMVPVTLALAVLSLLTALA